MPIKEIIKKPLVIGILLFTVGCGSVPTTGPVNAGLPIRKLTPSYNESQLAQAPVSGMSQTDIIRGFLFASTVSSGNLSTARKYLTTEVGFDWIPNRGIKVYETALDLEQIDQQTIAAIGIPSIYLDNLLRPKLPTKFNPETYRFSLVLENNEWRIANPPDHLIMSSVEFQRNFKIANLWFVDEIAGELIPDPVAISIESDPAAQLIRALRNGSRNWIGNSLTNYLSTESIGEFISIKQKDKTVSVDLETVALRLPARALEYLISQIAQTLHQNRQINTLEITVDGQILRVAEISNPLDLRRDSWIGKLSTKLFELYVLAPDKKFFKLGELAGDNSWLQTVSIPNRMTVHSRRKVVAAYSSTTSEILVGKVPGTPKVVARIRNLSGLNFDSLGRLWFVDRSSKTLFRLTGDSLNSIQFKLPINVEVVHAMTGPSNLKVAMVNKDRNSTWLSIARLGNNVNEIEIGETKRVITIPGEVLDLSWYSPTQVGLLIKSAQQQTPNILVIDITTASQTIIRIPIPAIAIDSSGDQDLAILGNAGEVWLRKAGSWVELDKGLAFAFGR
jgi:hypothetical protein